VDVTRSPSDDPAVALQTLERRWSSITDEPEPPQSLMDVIEYGLGDQRRAEVYVNRLLCYLLDPGRPHGMGSDFLREFLDGLPGECGFDEDTYNLSQVRVNEQVPVHPDQEADRSPGYADLVLDVPNEWLLLIELKFAAAETGTEFYSRAPRIDDQRVADYESGQYYLYLYRADKPAASGDCFANWTWEGFVEDLLEPYIARHSNRYPQRTATQLHDLRYDIREISSMTDRRNVDDEKIALYLEYADAIIDVSASFDDAWESYSEHWGEHLAESLDTTNDRVTWTPTGGFPEVEIDRQDSENERWIFQSNAGDWQHFIKDGWYRHEDDLRFLDSRADDRNDLRIGFCHRMQANRETAVRDRELIFNFRCMGSNPTEFADVYQSKFDARQEKIRELLADTHGELTGQKLTLITSSYEIEQTDRDGFFEAYTSALSDAFVDFVVDNPDLVATLGAAFEESITEYQ